MTKVRARIFLGALLLVSAATSVGCAPREGSAPPSDAITLRDLLAMDEATVRTLPDVERTMWRHRIDAALDDQAEKGEVRAADPSAVPAAPSVALALGGPMRIALTVDAERDDKGEDPVVASATTTEGALDPLAADSLFESTGDATGDGYEAVRTALATALPGEEIELLEAPGAPFAVLLAREDRLAWVNPVVRALADDAGSDVAPSVPLGAYGVGSATPGGRGVGPTAYWGDRNPYRFYSSVADCAAAEQVRCADCLGGNPDQCDAKLGGTSGSVECDVMTMTPDGFTLACIMYAFSMTTVEFCMDDTAAGCEPPGRPYDISALESYRSVLDDAMCFAALDQCIDPYRDGLSCDSPCDQFCSDLAEACTQPCTSGIDACSATGDACGETATGCGDSCSSGADSCSSACDTSSSACSCAIARPLPPRPVDPATAGSVGSRTAIGLRNLLAFVLPPLLLLFWRRRLGREVRP